MMIINTTQKKVSDAMNKIRAAGGNVSSSGISIKGVDAQVDFDKFTGRLTINITDKPWLVLEDFIESEIRKFFS